MALDKNAIPIFSATGAKAVNEGPPLKALKAVLETIQERAKYALDRLRTFEEPKSLGWQCVGCGHTKKFTRKVCVEAAPPCTKVRQERVSDRMSNKFTTGPQQGFDGLSNPSEAV